MRKLFVTWMAGCLATAVVAAPAKKETKPATPKAAEKVEFVIVESGEYTAGQEDPRLTMGIAQFLGMEPVVTKMTQLEAAQNPALANVDYSFLPLYLIKKTDAVRSKMEGHIKRGYVAELAEYIVVSHQTRTGVYTQKEGTKDQMEIFVMSQCPYGVMAENAVIEAKKKGTFPKDKTVRIRYIVNYDPANGFSSLHGPAEWEEDVRQLLIAKYYPTKLWQYLAIRNKDYRSSRWDKAMEAAGISVSKISKKFDTEGLELLKQEAQYGREYKVNASPTFLWEGKVLLDFGSASEIDGFSFLNPNAASGAKAAPAGSC